MFGLVKLMKSNPGLFARRTTLLVALSVTACASPKASGPLRPADQTTEQALRTATRAEAMSSRKNALLALNRLGQNITLPSPGSCARLEAAPGCDQSYYACARAWTCSGSCVETSGVALEIFSYDRPESLPADEIDDAGCGPAGPDKDASALATELETSPPFAYSLPDRVSMLLSVDDEVGSGREVCDGNGDDAFEKTSCHVVVADACNGRVGLVCQTGARPPSSTRDVGEFWLQPAE